MNTKKKVGIIIIAILLLGAVALVQTGKIQIPGLKSDALDSINTEPLNLNTTCSNITFNRDLNLGDVGNDVVAVQYFLKTHGYFFVNGDIPGHFDSYTVMGLNQFNITPSSRLSIDAANYITQHCNEATSPALEEYPSINSIHVLPDGNQIQILGSNFQSGYYLYLIDDDSTTNNVDKLKILHDTFVNSNMLQFNQNDVGLLQGHTYRVVVQNNEIGGVGSVQNISFQFPAKSVVNNSCPQITPPAPDFCKDGTIVDGGVDDLGCSLPATCAPKASLTANGSSDLNLPLGTPLSYTWSSGNAVSASSTYTTNKASCSSDNATSGKWIANTLQGSIASHILPAKYLGCSYVITYTVKDKDGKTTDSVLKLNIVDPPAPTATLKVNGSTGSVTAHVGDRMKYEWSSTAAESASSTYAGDKTRCGAGVWFIKKPNGTLTAPPLPPSYTGCVFTLNFKTTQSSTGKTATSTVVMTVQ